ncbi:hypothetical protein [Actinoalloteichus caeruleus]|uniref:ABC transporter n=1 Tax=Actinoalloteichus caeruleus DSM 43889 TaxID=1120930 RepID=A0ABT1JCI2_ACTCY|nr:hypothetical protein [Actinoalloteichus caeruleus]MCP2330190.1 hypothetical protein [Actinoalloteichus caeruleus DSM 43889]
MTRQQHTRAARLAAGLASVSVLIAACGSTTPAESPATVEEDVPHGYVEGAEETAEAQSRLVIADAETGGVRVLDLIDEEVHEVGQVEGVEDIAGDGRFGYVAGADDAVHVIDSGSWMVDHGDHVHYYRAEVRDVGTVDGVELTDAFSDPVVTAVSSADGRTLVLDRAELDGGTVVPRVEEVPVAGTSATVPYREHLLAPAGGGAGDGTVEIRDRDGEAVSTLDVTCEDPRGQALTRRGVVFGCADGALLVTEDDGRFDGELIAYPEPVEDGERISTFRHRPGSTTLVGTAGDAGGWLLDVTERTWRHWATTEPVVAANTAGEGSAVLVLTADGVLRGLDPDTGEETAAVPLLEPGAAAGTPAPVIEVDTTRAYVNDPTSGEIHEIDYNDDLRVARTLEVPGLASHMVETGR